MTLSAHAAEAPNSVEAAPSLEVLAPSPPELLDFEKFLRQAQLAERTVLWSLPVVFGGLGVGLIGAVLIEPFPVAGTAAALVSFTAVFAGEVGVLGGLGVATISGLRAYNHLDTDLPSAGARWLVSGVAVASFSVAGAALLYNVAPQAASLLGFGGVCVATLFWIAAPVIQIEQLLQIAPGGPREGTTEHRILMHFTVEPLFTVVDGQPALGLAGSF